MWQIQVRTPPLGPGPEREFYNTKLLAIVANNCAAATRAHGQLARMQKKQSISESDQGFSHPNISSLDLAMSLQPGDFGKSRAN